MTFLKTIVIFFYLFATNGCTNYNLRPERQDYKDIEYVIVPAWEDTIPILLSTNYFYRFTHPDFRDRNLTIEWGFGNLNHFGIQINDAWYYEGASNTYLGNFAFDQTIVPPFLVVDLTEQSSAILKHYFQPIEDFNPSVCPNGLQSKWMHYVKKQIK